MLDQELREVAEAITQTELIRAIGTGYRGPKPAPEDSLRRVELRPVTLREGDRLKVERFTPTQSFTSNVAWGTTSEEVVTQLLGLGLKHWRVETTSGILQVHYSKKGRLLRQWRPHAEGWQPVAPSAGGHDRIKRRLLNLEDPIFAALDLCDAAGRPKPRRVAKLRQIEEFLRGFVALLGEAPPDRLVLADLGCGNAYLTFAVAVYLRDRGVDFTIYGVDAKAQALRHNTAIADRFGLGDRVTFLQGAISAQPLPETPDVVLALHACDTASDDALAAAVTWQSRFILVAPCCHHDLASQLKRASGSPSIGQPAGMYGMMTRHGILRERLADTLTDAMRALVLGGLGYRVEVAEFVAGEHTPRNTLISAVHTNHQHRSERIAELHATCEFWGVTPRLKGLVNDRLG